MEDKKIEDVKIEVMPPQPFRLGRYKPQIVRFVMVLILVSLVYIWQVILPKKDDYAADIHFGECKMLASNCIDVATCDLNIYCGDGIFKDCRVYDCGNTYGVFTEDIDGRIAYKKEEKLDGDAAASMIAETEDACSGTMQIISQECVGKKDHLSLKLATKGACQIESFATLYENIGSVPNTFTQEGDTYSIITGTCGKITKIISAAKGGIGLELQQTGN